MKTAPRGAKQNAQMSHLYILGTGIRGLRQLTQETREALMRCRIVLHLSNQHEGLRLLNRNTVNLDESYWTGKDRNVVYSGLVKMVMDEVKKGPGVAIVTYGHPLFFDDVHMQLRKKCRDLGLSCTILPAVSCLDTICVDLGIDYGDGLQVFEATHLVNAKLKMCKNVHTLIFQIYEFGEDVTADVIRAVPGRFAPLEKHLCKFYPHNHRGALVYSEDECDEGTFRIGTTIGRLDTKQRSMFPGVTLYIPPLSVR